MEILKYLKSKLFLKTLLKMLIISVLLVFFLRYWLGCTSNHNQRIEVPNLSKMSLLKVKSTLDKLDLNYVLQDTSSYNPKYPPSSVIEQNPIAGDFVKEGRKIYLSLNRKGYRNIKMPNLLGKTKRQVASELLSLGFKIGTFSYVPDRGKNVVRGLKYKGKKIIKGDLIPKNSKIHLILGDGKGGNTFVLDTIK